MKTKLIVSAMMAVCLLAMMPANAQVPPENPWLDTLQSVDIVTLTDKDVSTLLKTFKELQAADTFDDTLADSPEGLESVAQQAEALGILKSNGYDTETFSSHMQNALLALGALQIQDSRAEIETSLAQLDEMAAMIPPGQLESMRSQITQMLAVYDRAPAGNIALMQKYLPDFEALGN